MIRNATASDICSIKDIIHTNLRTVNSVDYTEHVINFMIRHYSLDKLYQLCDTMENFYVYEDEEGILGCVILDDCIVKGLYVNPQIHGKGIGRKLMDYVESLGICDEIYLYASKSAYEFYKKLDYILIEEADDPDFGPSYYMKKICQHSSL